MTHYRINFNLEPLYSLAPSLYISNIHESVNKDFLYEYFSKFGSIYAFSMSKDDETFRYRNEYKAFITFVNAKDAETARQNTQYEVINGLSIRVKYSGKMSPMFQLVVKNLDLTINERQLHEFFDQTGRIVSFVEIRRYKDSSIGYVNYYDISDAKAALILMNGKKLGENQITVEKFFRKNGNLGKRCLLLKNLYFSSKEEVRKWIEDTFESYGRLDYVKVIPYIEGVFSAFIIFSDIYDEEAAFHYFSQSPTVFANGEKAYISKLMAKGTRKEYLTNRILFLKYLKLETTSRDIEDLFKPFGKIEVVVLKNWKSKDRKKKAKFGIIIFETRDTTLKVLSNLEQIPDLEKFAIENEKVGVFPYHSKQRMKFTTARAAVKSNFKYRFNFISVQLNQSSDDDDDEESARTQIINNYSELLEITPGNIGEKDDVFYFLDENKKKMVLGRIIFKSAFQINEKLASDITWELMSLYSTNSLMDLIESQKKLNEKISDCLEKLLKKSK